MTVIKNKFNWSVMLNLYPTPHGTSCVYILYLLWEVSPYAKIQVYQASWEQAFLFWTGASGYSGTATTHCLSHSQMSADPGLGYIFCISGEIHEGNTPWLLSLQLKDSPQVGEDT